MTDRRLGVLGAGAALPGPPVATAQLLDLVQRRFGVPVMRPGLAIARRLGVAARHLCRSFDAALEGARPGEGNPDLAALAVRRALAEAALSPNDLDFLIGHTATPARPLPPNIGAVADRLGFEGPFAEFRQACTGFANALAMARGLLASGARRVAIVGSETGSVFFDPHRAGVDRGQLVNLVQMGDGAGAVILGEGTPRGWLSHFFFAQTGRGRAPGLSVPETGSAAPRCTTGVPEFHHDFAAIREEGPGLLLKGAAAAKAAEAPEPDRYLPHQANGRIDEHLAPLLGIGRERVVVHADRVGNTGSAAIWLALATLRPELRPGETVLALGAEATEHLYGGFLYTHG